MASMPENTVWSPFRKLKQSDPMSDWPNVWLTQCLTQKWNLLFYNHGKKGNHKYKGTRLSSLRGEYMSCLSSCQT